MPLDQIHAVLEAPDLRTRSELISAHLASLEQNLARTQSAVASLRGPARPPVRRAGQPPNPGVLPGRPSGRHRRKRAADRNLLAYLQHRGGRLNEQRRGGGKPVRGDAGRGPGR
jgi:hypothetical protein